MTRAILIDRVTLPRIGADIDSGDWDVGRRALAVRYDRAGKRVAVLFHWPGHTAWAGRGEQRYYKGNLTLCYRDAHGEVHSKHFAEGETLCGATLKRHAAAINEVLGAYMAARLDPRKTLEIREE